MRQQLGVAPSRAADDITKTYVDTAVAACVKTDNNLSDLASASTARTNLGLGTAAVMAGPSSAIMGVSDTQTVTNKTIAGGLVLAGSSSGSTTLQASPGASGVVTLPSVVDTITTLNATQTLSNKTLTSPKFTTIVNTGTLTLPTSTDTLVGRATADTLSNKSISGTTNSLSAVPITALATTGTANSSTFLSGTGAWVIPGGLTGTSFPTADTTAEWDSNANFSAVAFIPGFTEIVTTAGTTTLTVGSTGIQQLTGTHTHTVVLPTTSIVAGMGYYIDNSSTGAVTVQVPGGTVVVILASNTSAFFTANVAAPNVPAGWDYYYYGLTVASGKTPVISNSLTLSGTDGTAMTFPTVSDTVTTLTATQTLTNKSISGSANTLSNIGLPSLASSAYSTTPTASTLVEWDTSLNLSANVLLPGLATTTTSATTTTLTLASAQVQVFTGTTSQYVRMPSTCPAGTTFTLINNSTQWLGALYAAGTGNQIIILPAGARAILTATVANPSSAGGWAYITSSTGLPYDLSFIGFGYSTIRTASSYGDNPMGIRLARTVTLTGVTFRCATADASGNLVVELRANGSQISGTSTTIGIASQVAGVTTTFAASFAAGTIITAYVTGVGATPGTGLVVDVTGITSA